MRIFTHSALQFNHNFCQLNKFKLTFVKHWCLNLHYRIFLRAICVHLIYITWAPLNSLQLKSGVRVWLCSIDELIWALVIFNKSRRLHDRQTSVFLAQKNACGMRKVLLVFVNHEMADDCLVFQCCCLFVTFEEGNPERLFLKAEIWAMTVWTAGLL